MGSIGDAFPYTGPVLGSTDWANWILCMDELIDRVSSQVPASALVGGDLDLNGQSIIDIFGAEFKNSADPPASTPGLIRYHNNEWYLVTAAGTVQVTSAGVLNAAAIGGIGGDYGTGPEDVRFVNANERYDFWDDYAGNAYGYVRARGFDINNGAGGVNYCRLAYGTGANITLTFPTALPAANRSVFTVTSGGQLEPNTAANTITNDIYLGNTEVKHTKEREVCYTARVDRSTGAAVWVETNSGVQVTVDPATVGTMKIQGIQVGWRIKSIRVRIVKIGAANSNISIKKYNLGVLSGTIATQNQGGIGTFTVTTTVGAPAATVANDHYIIEFAPTNVLDEFLSVTVVYDIP